MVSNSYMTCQNLIEKIEQEPKVFEVVEDRFGLSLWPFIRHPFLFKQTFAKVGLTSVGKGVLTSKRELLVTLLFSLLKNPFLLLFKKRKIWIVNSGITNIKVNGVYTNRFADYYYRQFPEDTVLLEETAYGKHSLPRAHKAVYSHLFVRLLAVPFSWVFFFDREKFRAKVQAMEFALKEILPDESKKDPAFFTEFKERLLRDFKIIYAEYVIYRVLIKWGRPKLMLIEDASYGSRAHLVRAAKEYKVKVVEYQHGTVNQSHLAYNFGQAIRQSTYLSYLPDYFLTFGDLWGKMINLPATKISIGNPHLSENVARLQLVPKSKTILVVGTGSDPASIIDIVLRLRKKYSMMGYQVVLRPHPLEYANIHFTYSRLLQAGIKLDTHPDLYQSLQNSEVVIGEYSTAIYEAVAFGVKVFLIRNKLSDSFGDESLSLFPALDNIEEQNIFDDVKNVSLGSTIWESEWKRRYNSFVNSVIEN